MSLAVTEPLSIPQLLDRGFQLFKQVLPKVLPLTIVTALLSSAPALLFAPHKTTTGMGLNHSGYFGIWMLIASLVSASIYIAVIRKVDDVAEGRNRLTLGEAYLGGFRLLPKIIGGGMLLILAVLVGLVLLVVPGFILMLSLSFFPFFIVLENQGVIDSLRNSHNLVWGHWWRWATIYTVVIAVFVGLGIAIGFVSGVLGHAASGADPSMGLQLGSFIAQALVSSISTPLIYSVQLIGFRDLQLRKGGADLASRIAQAA